MNAAEKMLRVKAQLSDEAKERDATKWLLEWLKDAYEQIDGYAKLEQAKQEDRLVMLPCKAEDTIYRIDTEENRINEVKCYCRSVTESTRGNKHSEWLIDLGVGVNGRVRSERYGKTVFLAREDAEKALKELEEERNAE